MSRSESKSSLVRSGTPKADSRKPFSEESHDLLSKYLQPAHKQKLIEALNWVNGNPPISYGVLGLVLCLCLSIFGNFIVCVALTLVYVCYISTIHQQHLAAVRRKLDVWLAMTERQLAPKGPEAPSSGPTDAVSRGHTVSSEETGEWINGIIQAFCLSHADLYISQVIAQINSVLLTPGTLPKGVPNVQLSPDFTAKNLTIKVARINGYHRVQTGTRIQQRVDFDIVLTVDQPIAIAINGFGTARLRDVLLTASLSANFAMDSESTAGAVELCFQEMPNLDLTIDAVAGGLLTSIFASVKPGIESALKGVLLNMHLLAPHTMAIPFGAHSAINPDSPITDIVVVGPGERAPPGYEPMRYVKQSTVVNTNEGTKSSCTMFIYFTRQPFIEVRGSRVNLEPITELAVIYSDSRDDNILEPCPAGYALLNRDLSEQNGGRDCMLCFRRGHGVPISSIAGVINDDTPLPPGYMLIRKDLNRGSSGSPDLFICYKRQEVEHPTIEHLWSTWTTAVNGRVQELPISDVVILYTDSRGGRQAESLPAGYALLDRDLSPDTGGRDVYIAYSRSPSKQPITEFRAVATDENEVPRMQAGFEIIQKDLNKHASGSGRVYLGFAREAGADPVVELRIIYDKEPVPPGFFMVETDLNKGTRSSVRVHLCYRKGRTPVDVYPREKIESPPPPVRKPSSPVEKQAPALPPSAEQDDEKRPIVPVVTFSAPSLATPAPAQVAATNVDTSAAPAAAPPPRAKPVLEPVITELAVIYTDGGSSAETVPPGFSLINRDLNPKTGGRDIFLCVRYDRYNQPIRDICVVYDDDDALVPPGYTRINKDINRKSSGSGKCFVGFSRTEGEGPIAEIAVLYDNELPPPGWTRVPSNLNFGTKSSVRVYLCYRRTQYPDTTA